MVISKRDTHGAHDTRHLERGMKRQAISMVLVFAAAGCSADETSTQPTSDMGVERDLEAPDVENPTVEVSATRIFPTDDAPGHEFEDCMFASSLHFADGDRDEIIGVAGETVAALDPLSGDALWTVDLPAPDGERPFTMGTPARVDDLLIVAYYTTSRTDRDDPTRLRHLVAVVDLQAQEISTEFETVELTGPFESNDGGIVPFPASNALSRPEIVIGHTADSELGYAYVTFGNARDIQPWHGFAFELDLDSWRAQGRDSAVSAQFVTTPEEDCGPSGVSGSRDRICGGGLWAPSGPLMIQSEDSFEMIFAPGNGQLDLPRRDYANTLMRFDGPGLEFNPGCDEDACAEFDPDEPSLECIESCSDLFVPRLPDGTGPFTPESGACDGMTLFECWETLDYIGGSTPSLVELEEGRVLAYPTKDGSVFLVDYDHMGTLHDREQLVEVCGTRDERCRWDWAGMIVTQPAQTTLGGQPLLIVPTFMPDTTHPAGIVGLQVTENEGEGPGLEVAWQAPNFSSPEALERFREHTSRPALQTLSNGVEIVWVAEALRSAPQGNLVGVRAWDGEIVEDRPLAMSGNRFTLPLVVEDRVYIPSCNAARDMSVIEGYRIDEVAR